MVDVSWKLEVWCEVNGQTEGRGALLCFVLKVEMKVILNGGGRPSAGFRFALNDATRIVQVPYGTERIIWGCLTAYINVCGDARRRAHRNT
jgi:hypothetical protein